MWQYLNYIIYYNINMKVFGHSIVLPTQNRTQAAKLQLHITAAMSMPDVKVTKFHENTG